jgi:hypothetical protein
VSFVFFVASCKNRRAIYAQYAISVIASG